MDRFKEESVAGEKPLVDQRGCSYTHIVGGLLVVSFIVTPSNDIYIYNKYNYNNYYLLLIILLILLLFIINYYI